MAFGSGDAERQHLLLKLKMDDEGVKMRTSLLLANLLDDVAVLCVNSSQRTDLLAVAERLEERVVSQHVTLRLVRHVKDEAVDPLLLGQLRHLLLRTIGPGADDDRQAEIAHHLVVGPRPPSVERSHQRLSGIREDGIDYLNKHYAHC